MNEVIERLCQLEELEKCRDSRVFIDPIYSNERFHPKFRSLLGVYFHPLDLDTGTIINISHPEALSLSYEKVYSTLQSFSYLFTLNKKDLLYQLPLPKTIDINLIYTFENFDRLVLPDDPSTIKWMYRYHKDRRDMNLYVPLSKLYEKSLNRFLKVKESIETFKETPEFTFYNNDGVSVLFLIEKEGIKVNSEEITKKYNIETPELNIRDNTAYTYFNLYNNTSRPTNSFNQINFSAIPHKPEYREHFLPKNDKFIELDFDGYHLRLIGNLIGYPFTEESAHLQLGKEYFNKSKLTEQEYSTTKQINFSSIYGNPPQEYKHTPFISKLEKYTDQLWEEFNREGYIRDAISGRKLSNKLSEMYPKKLFNYSVQSLETSRNILILKEVLRYLRDKRTKIALYTYDSVVVDFSDKDGNELITNIKSIMEQEKKFPTGTKQGNTLVL